MRNKSEKISVEIHGVRQYVWDIFEKERDKRNISIPDAIEGALYLWIKVGRISRALKGQPPGKA